MNRKTLLLNYYGAMFNQLGASNWWPGESPFEVAIGAILTQNTNWNNVEKALWNLKNNGYMEPGRLFTLPVDDLAELIRPAGYFRIKANRIRHFLLFLRRESGLVVEELSSLDSKVLRNKLLEVKGIGPETADSIMLYALGKPSFVVDAYTRRIFSRHGLIPEDTPYEELRDFFMDVLPRDTSLYNEYHALLVRVGKTWCKKREEQCNACPLHPFLK